MWIKYLRIKQLDDISESKLGYLKKKRKNQSSRKEQNKLKEVQITNQKFSTQ